MVDVQVVEDPDPPSGTDQTEGKIILLGLHEEGAVQAARRPQRFAPKADPASDEYSRQGASLLATVRQMNSEAGRPQQRVILESADHPFDRTGAWV